MVARVSLLLLICVGVFVPTNVKGRQPYPTANEYSGACCKLNNKTCTDPEYPYCAQPDSYHGKSRPHPRCYRCLCFKTEQCYLDEELVKCNCPDSGTQGPFCIPDTPQGTSCGDPPSVVNGILVANGNQVGDTAEVTCDVGFGTPLWTSTCQENGQWSDVLAECLPVTGCGLVYGEYNKITYDNEMTMIIDVKFVNADYNTHLSSTCAQDGASIVLVDSLSKYNTITDFLACQGSSSNFFFVNRDSNDAIEQLFGVPVNPNCPVILTVLGQYSIVSNDCSSSFISVICEE